RPADRRSGRGGWRADPGGDRAPMARGFPRGAHAREPRPRDGGSRRPAAGCELAAWLPRRSIPLTGPFGNEHYAAAVLTGAVSAFAEKVPSISSNERPLVSNPMNQNAMIPTTYQQAKYVKAGPSEARLAAGLIGSLAPRISASPSGPKILPLFPT